MTQHTGHFDEFQPHTRLKHAILDSYIVAWAMKLLMWGMAGDHLVIVDAFAGAGQDKSGNAGSPLIAVRRANEAMAETKRLKPNLDPKVQVIAIEKKPTLFRQLEQTLAPFVEARPALVRAHLGELAEHIDAIVSEIGSRPAFFFLDPYGIKGLDARTYPKALAGPHNEIFALFSDIGAVRLHGLVTAERADVSDEVAAILEAPSFFPEDDTGRIAETMAGAERTNNALDASIPASREHLTRALGSEEWVSELAAVAAQHRSDTFVSLFQKALLRAGARFVLAVPMRNDAGQRVYELVHASKSRAGLITMKECVSSGLRKSSISTSARDRIVADLSVDVHRLVQALQTAFAGRSIPWAARPDGLKLLVLGHTALFHFQLVDLKSALKQAGVLRRVALKDVCVFPAAPSTVAPWDEA